MSLSGVNGDGEPTFPETIRILARFIRLALPEERYVALETGFASALDEHEMLRAQPLELEPSVVFDPRWD